LFACFFVCFVLLSFFHACWHSRSSSNHSLHLLSLQGGDTDKLVHQIQIDIKRTNCSMPEFHNEETHSMFERILFIWAFRHPSSG
jgi:hypothetical protein